MTCLNHGLPFSSFTGPSLGMIGADESLVGILRTVLVKMPVYQLALNQAANGPPGRTQ